MTAMEIYAILKKMGVEFDVIEICEGSRLLRIEIDEEDLDEQGDIPLKP